MSESERNGSYQVRKISHRSLTLLLYYLVKTNTIIIEFVFNLYACFVFTACRNEFADPWTKYLKIRGIEDGQSEPRFPEDFTDITVRETFYNKEFSFAGWHGSSGHDAPLVA